MKKIGLQIITDELTFTEIYHFGILGSIYRMK